ncbi:4-hydroxythreonine-4-phosphate dehydrogenase [Alicycliphilus sp. B1]|nr:4-hydroxythreonine-4-phosphate dehydrogenase [Alicycliphilus sp. B1]
MNSTTNAPLPLAITQGDPAGIGPEIVAKAFRDAPQDLRGCFVVGDLATLRRACGLRRSGRARPACRSQLLDSPDAWAQGAAALSARMAAARAGQAALAPWGQVSAEAGRMPPRSCVVWAARAALRGEIAGLVTAPLHKEALGRRGRALPRPHRAAAGRGRAPRRRARRRRCRCA